MSESELALEVVKYAVFDWRRLVSTRAWENEKFKSPRHIWQVPNCQCNFDELRRFFRGEWCDFILRAHQASTTGERILRLLEEELEAAKAEASEKGRKKP